MSRVRRVVDLLALSLAALLAAGAASPIETRAPVAAAASTGTAPHVSAVGCVGLTVSDLDRSVAFYTAVLAFRQDGAHEVVGAPWEELTGVLGARTRTARLRLGGECLELTEYLVPAGRPPPPDARSNDRGFQHVAIVVSDMDAAYARLRAAGAEHVSAGPQRLPGWNPDAGGIRAFYFKDPDRHVLEVIQFPVGKGDPRWQRAAPGRLFLGIDHTAIVVGDTDASLQLYRDVLGFRIAGTSENWGTEQERLNDVPRARLRITSLRAAAGPGIELLEYLAPRDGRPYPTGERGNDLVHWHTTLLVHDVDATASALRAAGSAFVSPRPVDLPDASLGFDRALRARDPDGHVLQLAASSSHDAAARARRERADRTLGEAAAARPAP